MGWKLQWPEGFAPAPANTDTFVATDATNARDLVAAAGSGEGPMLLPTNALEGARGPQSPWWTAQIYLTRWKIGVSSQGHISQPVQVRPRPTDSSLVAGEAPWRESKKVKSSDNMLVS